MRHGSKMNQPVDTLQCIRTCKEIVNDDNVKVGFCTTGLRHINNVIVQRCYKFKTP